MDHSPLARLYTVIVVNLVLWLAVVGSTYYDVGNVRVVAFTGLIVAATSQHWAYYALRKARDGYARRQALSPQ